MLLPLRRSTFGAQVDAVGRPDEQQHGAVVAVGVDQQLDLVAGGVLALVGDQLDVVEAEVACRRSPRRATTKTIAALDGVLLGVGQPGTTGDTGPARRP